MTEPRSVDPQEAPRASEQQFRALFDTMLEGVVVIAPDGQISQANPAAERILGLARSEIERRHIIGTEWAALRPDGTPMPPEEFATLRSLREKRAIEHVVAGVQCTDGAVAWIDVCATPLIDKSGELQGAVATFSDITEQKQAQDALRESERAYRTLAQNLPGLVYRVFLREGRRMQFFNTVAQALTGYTEEELTQGTVCSLDPLIVSDDRPGVIAAVERAIAEHTPFTVEYRLRHKDGRLRCILEQGTPIYGADGEPLYIDGVAFDITDRKATEQALAESSRRVNRILESITDGFFAVDHEWRYTYINQEAERILRRPREELLGKRVWDEFPQLVGSAFYHGFHTAVSSQQPVTLEEFFPPLDRWFAVRAYPSQDGLAVYFRDVTQRKEAEQSLHQQALIIDQIHDGVVSTDLDGYVTSWNKGAERLYGYSPEEALGRHISFVYPEDQQEVLEAEVIQPLKAKGSHELEVELCKKSGERFYADLALSLLRDNHGAASGMIGYSTDITERKRSEAVLQESEERYRTQYQSIPVPTYTWQRSGDDFVLVDYNVAAEVATDGRIADFVDVGISRMYADRPDIIRDFSRCFRERTTITRELDYSSPLTDTRGHFIVNYVFIPPDWILVHTQDITDRKETEEALRRYAERLQILREIDEDVLSAVSVETIARATLNRLQELLPCTGADVVLFDWEANVGQLVAVSALDPTWLPELGERTPRHVPLEAFPDIESLQQGQVHFMPDVLTISQLPAALHKKRADGMRSSIHVPLLAQGKLIGSLNVGSDQRDAFSPEHIQIAGDVANHLALAIEQARLVEELRSAHERLQAVSRRLTNAEEAERRRISQELHDDIGQSLTVLKLNLQSLRNVQDIAILAPRLEQSIASVEGTLQRVRNLALDLRPSMLDDLGLVSTLRWYLDRQSQWAGFATHLTAQPAEMYLPPMLGTTCFRIVQEALTNIMRHAQAQHVWVDLRRSNGELDLRIRDDGAGFDVSAALERAAAGASLGLLGMRERVRLAGGDFEIESTPGRGTELRIRFPIPET